LRNVRAFQDQIGGNLEIEGRGKLEYLEKNLSDRVEKK